MALTVGPLIIDPPGAAFEDFFPPFEVGLFDALVEVADGGVQAVDVKSGLADQHHQHLIDQVSVHGDHLSQPSVLLRYLDYDVVG